MKKLFLTMIFTALLYCSANADTIVNVPIDSRPISTDYLENLAEIGRDTVITMDKKNMDFFSSYEPDNHIGNSAEVRKEVENTVRANNNPYTTVIINTSSYITNGLVGSRCSVNYSDYKSALKDLEKLTTENTNPRYYVNITMPRALPETRFNTIWADNNKVKGLGWFYLKENENCENYDVIYNTYAYVTPEQLLMEYSYVENKALELGGYNKLTKWERSFIHDFNAHYKNGAPYSTYVENYKSTYEDCADIFAKLVEFREKGLIDEIIVSNDDLQLPNSITYFAGQNAQWVQKEEGSAIKYSFARTYRKIAPTSVERIIRDKYGADVLNEANNGRGKYINIINGTDEVPQLIYARDYSKRKNISPSYNIITNNMSEKVSDYDVKRAGLVTRAAVAFASGNIGIYTEKPVDMYIYDYSHEGNDKYILNNISKSISKGNNTALIELFGTGSVSKGNYILESLLKSDKLSSLCAYSAWNTNGNAIGLGVAQAQVFSVADENTNSPINTAQAQAKCLLQHYIEDGVYTSRVKRELSGEGYRPDIEARTHSQMLYDRLDTDNYINAIKNHIFTVKGDKYEITKLNVDRVSFPWGRTFDILIDMSSSAKNVK